MTGQVVTLVLMVIGRGSDVREPFFSFFFLSGYNSLDRPDLVSYCSPRDRILSRMMGLAFFLGEEGRGDGCPHGIGDVSFLVSFASSSLVVLRVILRGSGGGKIERRMIQ